MTTLFRQWAARHPEVSFAALAEYEAMLGVAAREVMALIPGATEGSGSESRQSSLVRVGAAKAGHFLQRNNVGALLDDRGVPVRYGLLNDSSKLNDKCKSSDFIGLYRERIQAHQVGDIIGRYWAVEMKKEDWVFNPNDEHEVAQLEYLNLVNRFGGRGQFMTGPHML